MRYALGALVTIMIVTSCSAGIPASQDETATDNVDYLGQMLAPVDVNTYEFEDALAECMSADGFEYTPVERTPELPQQPYDTIEDRQSRGFGVSFDGSDIEVELDTDPNTARMLSAGEQERQVWTAAFNTCQEELLQASYDAKLFTYDAMPDELRNRFDNFIAGITDEQLQALDDWSNCTAELGLGRYATDFELIESIRTSWEAIDQSNTDAVDAFKAEEIRIATAEFPCTRDHLIPVSEQLFQEINTEIGLYQ